MSTAPKSVLTSADTVAAVLRGNDWTGTVTGHVTPRAGFMHRATNHRWQNSIEVLSRLCLRVKTHANPRTPDSVSEAATAAVVCG